MKQIDQSRWKSICFSYFFCLDQCVFRFWLPSYFLRILGHHGSHQMFPSNIYPWMPQSWTGDLIWEELSTGIRGFLM